MTVKSVKTKIEKLEEEKSALEKEMNTEAATNYIRLSEISEQLSAIEARIEEIFLDMEEAETFLAKNKT